MEKPFEKEILIFVAGATPQIITETIFALSRKTPPVYPDEIYIITTAAGKRTIKESLIEKKILDKLIKEYRLPVISLKDESFVVVRDKEGRELEDIRDEVDNERIGDLITSFIREKARDYRVRLHCSLAGGRKTMSFYLGSAVQLFGRPWDKLYHVLVTPEFEHNPEFFYKPKKDRTIHCRLQDGSVVEMNTRDAKIQLAELPIIRLGGRISLQGKGFKELVEEGQSEIDTATVQPYLIVNLSERTVQIEDNTLEMIPMQLMIYTAFLRSKVDHCRYPERKYCLECTDCFQTITDIWSRPLLEEMAKDYVRIYGGKIGKKDDLLERHKNGIDPQLARQIITKINRTIKEQLPDEKLHPYYIISNIKKYGSTRYGVRIEKMKIRIE